MTIRQRIICSAAGAIALTFAGGTAADAAHWQNDAAHWQNTAPGGRSAMQQTSQANQELRAAGEPFENLTESAFTASPATLNRQIATAAAAARRVRPWLTRNAVRQLDAYLGDMHRAYQRHDRADIALASVEGYRVLVSSVSGPTKVPVAVNLLDYAGFRYTADLKARPTRWSDMAQAANFGQRVWLSLEPHVPSAQLRRTVSGRLSEMHQAVASRDAAAAYRAGTAELDLVDQLEKQFG